MNLFKLIGSLGNLSKVQQDVAEITQEIGVIEYSGQAGGEMVTVVVTGSQQLVNCSIDPKLFEEGDRELIEELLVSAANQALANAKHQTKDLMQQKLSEKLNMPELSGLIDQIIPKT